MNWITNVLARLRRANVDEELDAELAHHLAMKQRELERDGLTPEEARFAARRSLGNLGAWKETTRSLWRFEWLDALTSDVCYSLRLLRKDRIFTFVALVTLALGIGANTAIFALLNGLLWRPLPVEHPEELVRLTLTHLPPTFKQWVNGKPVKADERRQMTFAMYGALQTRQRIFSGIFATAGGGDMQVEFNGSPHRVVVKSVSGSFFPVLGIPPQMGRLLTKQDDVPGATEWPAVISDELWTRIFSRNPSAVGAAITIERTPFRIVGIAPAAFQGTNPGVETDAWVPLSALEAIYPTFQWRTNRSAWVIEPTARLRSGVTIAQARQYLAAIAPAVLEDAKDPALTGQGLKYFVAMKFEAASAAAGESWLAQSYGDALWILLAAVGAVLLIAVTNLTNLFMARTAARRHEIALRISLGAPAWRIRRQLLMESAALAIGGTIGGVIGAQWLIAAFEAAASRGNSAMENIRLNTSIDWRVFAFLAAMLVTVMMIAGLAPAYAASRVRPQEALKKRGGGSPLGFRRGLIVLQTAFSLTLIAGAGLMLASLRGLIAGPTGFEAENSAFVLPDLYNAGVRRETSGQVYARLLERTRELPDVIAAGWILYIPLTGSFNSLSVEVPGRADLSVEQRTVFENRISDGYFSAAGIPMLTGTDLPPAESRRADVCALSESAAKRFFGSARAAIGQRVKPGDDSMEVIGVVADAKYENVREAPPPTLYVPYWSGAATPGMALAVRYRGPFEAVFSSLQILFRMEAGRLPYTQVSTIRGNVSESVGAERMLAWLLGGFAAFALLISVIGPAGLLAYSVEQRRQELGIRLALGATPGRIRRDVQLEGLMLTAVGLAGGVALSFALRRSLNAFLYGVAAADARIWALGIALLLSAAIAATTMPARRAASVDPSKMLRDE